MSFDNLNKDLEDKKANIFLLMALTALSYGILLLGMLLPFVAIMGLALIAVPATVLVLTGRKRDGIICAVAGSLFMFFVNYLLAVFFIIYIVSVCFLYLRFYKEDSSPYRIILYSGLVLTGVLLAYSLAVSIADQASMYTGFLESYRQYIDNITEDPLIGRYAELTGISKSQMDLMIGQSRQVLLFIPYLLPSLLTVFIFGASLLNYYFSTYFLKRYGVFLVKIKDFADWDIPWYYCWGIIGGLVFVLIPDFNAVFDRVLDIAGFNLLAVFISLYTVLGFSVIIGIFKKYKLSVGFRFIIFFILLFLGIIFLVPLLGLADIWINIRRLKRK
jgi:hypothetical protein